MSATTSTPPDLSPEIQGRLADYRRQIDTLDKELISLLKKRIRIVGEVGKMKRKETGLRCLIRSGREAEMVRHLYQEFQGSDFAPEAAAAMWRLIIAASTHHETPLKLAIYGDTSGLAAEYFGSFLPQAPYDTPEEALRATAASSSTIAIIPAEDLPLDSSIWRSGALRIFAMLPFIPSPLPRPQAYAIAQILPEKTDNDTSLFLLEEEEGACILLKKKGYHTADEPEIRQLQLEHSPALRHIHWLGSYANPIS